MKRWAISGLILLVVFGGILVLTHKPATNVSKSNLIDSAKSNSIGNIILFAPTAYFFSDLTWQGSREGRYGNVFPHLEKIVFNTDGTYQDFSMDLQSQATSSNEGIWSVRPEWNDVLLTPVPEYTGNGFDISLASSTPEDLSPLHTQSFSKASCEDVSQNIWVESLGGCWEENRALDTLKDGPAWPG